MAYRNQTVLEADRSILVVGLNGKVFGLDRGTGEMRWRNHLEGAGYEGVFVAMRYAALVVSSNQALIVRIDYFTGATLWQARTRAKGKATILIEADRIVVSKGGYIDCFTLSGAPMWQQPLRGQGIGAAALGFPNNVEQANEDNS